MFKQFAHKVTTVFQKVHVARIMRSRIRGAERDKTGTYILSEKPRGKEGSTFGSYNNSETVAVLSRRSVSLNEQEMSVVGVGSKHKLM